MRPEYWSTIIAIIALILSQIPPIKDLLKGTSIKVEIPEFFSLSSFLGNLNLVFFLSIQNDGGNVATITKITCTIKNSENNQIWSFPAQVYFLRNTSNSPTQTSQEFPIGRIILKPNEIWNETVRFNNFFSIEEEEEVNQIISKLKMNISEKRKNVATNEIVYADESLVDKAKQFFDNKFNLIKGNYKLFISVKSKDQSLVHISGYEFTLFESYIKSLKEIKDFYSTGEGIFFFNVRKTDSYCYPRLRPMDEIKVRKEFKEINEK